MDASFLKKPRHTLYTNGSLELSNLQTSDAGKYSCMASNGIGKDLIQDVTLTIKGSIILSFVWNMIIFCKQVPLIHLQMFQ